MVTYSSSVIPIFLITLVLPYVERFVNKVVPSVVKFILRPVLTILIMAPISLCVLGPLGSIIGDGLVNVLLAIEKVCPWALPTVIGAFMPFLVMTGMHYSLLPAYVNSLSMLGYETVIGPGNLPSNIAQGAAALCVAIKTKNKNFRQLAVSGGVTALLGVTEPALFGVNVRLRKPLIATTIVESGIDVPNANTIIINNAQQFGLSDLHQLRGRVGRSNRKAFCYLLSPPLTSLTQEARRRLQAIENFSELGSGIHIAMQDLDIRGAGNMLGAEQSGFIADLGYETYQKILEEAVDELKSEEFADLYADNTEGHRDTGSEYVRETYIESDLELMFPPTYIPNDSERISLYRELDNMEEERDILAFTERLKDRFGKIPKEGKELIRIVRLRRMAKKLGMEKVVLKKGQMSLFLVNNPDSPYYQSEAFGKLLGFIQKHPRECNLREQNGKRSIVIKNVPTVEAACGYLQEMEKINSTDF